MRAMRATPGQLPAGPGWAYEMCWRGTRLLVDVTAGAVVVTDDADSDDVTARYPELVVMSADLPDSRLDGLVVTVGEAPMSFVAIDLLRLYGVDLGPRSFAERRSTLERLGSARTVLTVSPAFDDLAATVAAARQHALPGVIAKRLASTYRPGPAGGDWVEHRFAAGPRPIRPA